MFVGPLPSFEGRLSLVAFAATPYFLGSPFVERMFRKAQATRISLFFENVPPFPVFFPPNSFFFEHEVSQVPSR